MQVAFKEREGTSLTWRAGAGGLQECVREPHSPAVPREGVVGRLLGRRGASPGAVPEEEGDSDGAWPQFPAFRG